MKATSRRFFRRIMWTAAGLFVLMNVVAALHAWRFTHFSAPGGKRHTASDPLPFGTKLKYALTGVDNPRPEPGRKPDVPFTAFFLQTAHGKLAVWRIDPASDSADGYSGSPKGNVLLFHGYSGEKSGMLNKAIQLRLHGYRVWLADFIGGGASGGSTCTIGYREAEDVAALWQHVAQISGTPVLLYGTSMGAVAIMKCISDAKKQPDAVILECPFATMYGTVCARFRMVGMPAFPMAGLLTFWGGVENGFNAFAHNPADYAKEMRCPVLLLWGEKDDRVSREEIDRIQAAIPGRVVRHDMPASGHTDYSHTDEALYNSAIAGFLSTYSSLR